MKKLNDVALKLLAKAAYANAEKEANSACLFIGYQPKMPQKVKELKERKYKNRLSHDLVCQPIMQNTGGLK